jgi:hypothetical protein
MFEPSPIEKLLSSYIPFNQWYTDKFKSYDTFMPSTINPNDNICLYVNEEDGVYVVEYPASGSFYEKITKKQADYLLENFVIKD